MVSIYVAACDVVAFYYDVTSYKSKVPSSFVRRRNIVTKSLLSFRKNASEWLFLLARNMEGAC